MFIKPALCFLIGGTLVAYIGFTAIRFLRSIKQRGIESQGTIIRFEPDNDGHKSPFITFTTVSGEEISGKPFVYASTDLSIIRTYKNSIDQPVSVLYDPEHPERFVLKNEEGFNYFVFVILLLAGMAFML